MICILRVVEGPATGMKCWLKSDQRITIGRLSTSDFGIAADQHMSRTHLIVEGSEAGFRVRDAGSSNGTYVNDSRITILELCAGDRIRAGTTTFQVDIEAVQGGVKSPKPVEIEMPPEEFPIPQRTLSSESLDFIDCDETKRFSFAQIQELVKQADLNPPAPVKVIPDAPVPVTPVPVTPVPVTPVPVTPVPVAPMLVTPIPRDPVPVDPVPRDAIPATFLSEFPVQVGKSLWKQAANGSGKEARQVVDRLSLLDWDATLSLIINRSQIEDSECGTLDFSISTGESRRLTETLYLLQSKSQPVVLEFFRRCLHKDAAVCIASPKQLEDKWILDAIDALSYPSMLFELVSNSQDRAVKLTQGTYFLLFEPSSQSELCLLRSE